MKRKPLLEHFQDYALWLGTLAGAVALLIAVISLSPTMKIWSIGLAACLVVLAVMGFSVKVSQVTRVSRQVEAVIIVASLGCSSWLVVDAVAALRGTPFPGPSILALLLPWYVELLLTVSLVVFAVSVAFNVILNRGRSTDSLWSRLPFSRSSQLRRIESRLLLLDRSLMKWCEDKVREIGFTEFGARAALYGAITGRLDDASWDVDPSGTATPEYLFLGSRDVVTRVESPTADAGDALDQRKRFDAVAAEGRSLPESQERRALVARIERLNGQRESIAALS